MKSLTVEESLIIYLKIIKNKLTKTNETLLLDCAGSEAVFVSVFVDKSQSFTQTHTSTHTHIKKRYVFVLQLRGL